MCPEHQPAAQAGCDIVTALPPARTQQSMPARELVRDSVPGVTGAGHMGSPTWPTPKFQTPRGKQVSAQAALSVPTVWGQ